MRETEFAARSALGTAAGQAGAVIWQGERLRITEQPWLQVCSVRASRRQADMAALQASLPWPLPAQPNTLSGDAQRGCAWIEPRAWLLTGLAAMPSAVPAGVMITDISDRTAVFELSGELAPELLAAGCALSALQPGSCARTRFNGLANVVIQRWDTLQWRLLIDVSLAPAFALWLRQTAENISI